jgi:hypothetical protein
MDTVEYKIVKELEDDIITLNNTIESKKKTLKIASAKLENICDHNFIAEDNGDYHKSGYYYTCSVCKYWTNIRPEKYKS